jgi:hypothetical protein
VLYGTLISAYDEKVQMIWEDSNCVHLYLIGMDWSGVVTAGQLFPQPTAGEPRILSDCSSTYFNSTILIDLLYPGAFCPAVGGIASRAM